MELVYPGSPEIKEINHMAWWYMLLSEKDTAELGKFKPGADAAEIKEMLDKKKDHIYRGRRGQEWFYRLCEMNRIPFSRDYSRHSVADSDDLDVIVVEKICEVKTSKMGLVPYHVFDHCQKRDNADYYIFLDTSKDDVSIIPLGAMTCSEYWKSCTRVAEGDLFPGTQMVADKDSTVLSPEKRKELLIPIEHLLETILREYVVEMCDTFGEALTNRGTGWDRFGVEKADGELLAGQLPHGRACELLLMRQILEDTDGTVGELKKRAGAIYHALKSSKEPPGQTECIIHAMRDMLAAIKNKWFARNGKLKQKA